MSWYAQSKLMDHRDINEEQGLNNICMYCDRWETHPTDIKGNRKEAIWKTYDELDNEEKNFANMAIKNESRLSHGLCKKCYNILETIFKKGLNQDNFGKEKIKELSLSNNPIVF